mmetsp:Transcript_12979/g.31693  ORF Transcript_12979/g.31693 Transcript_12979/m.31693 type:complete len:239 (+) Transcript_12979:2810-3526(+)
MPSGGAPAMERLLPSRAMLRREIADPSDRISNTLALEPYRATDRTLKELPRATASSVDTWLPSLENERRLIALDRWANPSTDSSPPSLNVTLPAIENADESLADARSDRHEPKFTKSSTEQVLPNRFAARTDTDDARWVKPSTDSLVSARASPTADNPDPMRRTVRTDSAEPRFNRSSTEARDPNRAAPLIENDDAISRKLQRLHEEPPEAPPSLMELAVESDEPILVKALIDSALPM